MKRGWPLILAAVLIVDATSALRAQAADDGIYFVVRANSPCSAPPRCGGAFVSRANQQETRCEDGTFATECLVDAIEPASGAALSRASIRQAIETRPELRAIVRASPVSRREGDTLAEVVLSATEVWRPIGRRPGEGILWAVDDAGIRCPTVPCPSLRVRKLGERETILVSAVDLDLVRGGEADLKAANAALGKRLLVVAGAIRVGAEAAENVLVATQLYLPVSASAPEPARPAP